MSRTLVSPPPARSGSGLLLGIVVGLVLAAILGAVVVGPLALVHHGAGALELAYANGAVGLVSRLGARGIGPNPLAGNPRAIQRGRDAYVGSCAQCHGVNGDGKGVFGPITFPPATDLTRGDAKERSDAQLFYIIKNGLSFTPMPGYASQYSDQDLWAIVSYLRALQSGQAQTPAVPTPTAQQVSFADFQSADAARRGAAVYFAQSCADCHGPVGDAPGNLALRETRDITRAVRLGRPGMPCYDATLIDDAQMSDLQAYVATFRANRSGGGEGEGGGEGGGGEGGFGGDFGEGGPSSACAPTG